MGITLNYSPSQKLATKYAEELPFGVHELGMVNRDHCRGLYLRAFDCLIGFFELEQQTWHWDADDSDVAKVTHGPLVLVYRESIDVEIRELGAS